MNVVIIEDEVQTAWDLQTSISSLRPGWKILAMLDSVETGLEWFSHNSQPDLIFSDIQLGDGLAFDIFNQVNINCPVIFCTAYDVYALQAFKNFGIDYLLKPVNEDALKASIDKIDQLQFTDGVYSHTKLEELARLITAQNKSYRSTFLINYRDKIIPLLAQDILFFQVTENGICIVTNDGHKYMMNSTLEAIEEVINPQHFYRANRQFLISFWSIKEVETYFDRKLLVNLTLPKSEEIIISKARSSHFLKWLQEH